MTMVAGDRQSMTERVRANEGSTCVVEQSS